MGNKPYHDPDVLKELHHEQRLRLSEIAKKFGVDDSTIHYHFNKHDIEKRPKTLSERFEEGYEVDDESGCWVWQKSKHDFGYGETSVDGEKVRAHRVSYELHNGDIDDGSFVCHKCNNPECVNPDHLYEGTPQSNADDAVAAETMPHSGAFDKGEDHPQSELTKKEVVLMRERAEYGYTVKTLAEDFDIDTRTVRNILNGERWSHAGGPIQGGD